MKSSTVLKWISGGLEAFLAIPVFGAAIILGLYWLPLAFMLVMHIVTLVSSASDKRNIHGSILGIVTSCLGWIPFLGWTMHVITATLLLVDAYKSQKRDNEVVENINF
ncbi:hypothetical protein [Alkalihalobacterium bogoriense]|uniref:hypothetical protein n=1 Tax=Alkalihalobacterium bogoriense TaxID=246272 RepID=UPI00054E8134|nr:hypothetical protein [Alkalihalobacterium bogoriense]